MTSRFGRGPPISRGAAAGPLAIDKNPSLPPPRARAKPGPWLIRSGIVVADARFAPRGGLSWALAAGPPSRPRAAGSHTPRHPLDGLEAERFIEPGGVVAGVGGDHEALDRVVAFAVPAGLRRAAVSRPRGGASPRACRRTESVRGARSATIPQQPTTSPPLGVQGDIPGAHAGD